MTSQSKALARLQELDRQHLLCGGLKGIEKESLRITSAGLIAQTDHPCALGSALTHPYITTDYSEALIELITPPFADVVDTLAYLRKLHQYVYPHLGDELLLGTSMPCGISRDEDVRIAEYGSSNVGRLKHIYRHGLWHRYGRTMQSIAGIHFNYSVPEGLWPMLHQQARSPLSLEKFTADGYFGLIRNFQRVSWLVLYLFGASPAICSSFFNSRPELKAQFDAFDSHTLYHPYATSLRMSDIGYKSQNQARLNVDYNSLNGYVDSLCKAINTPHPDYQKIGVLVDGQYRQLNSNILQIENEFYSTMRPKQIARSCEKPTLALKRRGVRYVEMRALDLNLVHPIGIDRDCACFIEALLLSCLLADSPIQSVAEQQINNQNQLAVAHKGRKPGLLLTQFDQTIPLPEWAQQVLDFMRPICAILDEKNPDQPYQHSLDKQQACLDNPDLTPSARMLAHMSASSKTFAAFALEQSQSHADYFRGHPLAAKDWAEFTRLAAISHKKQYDLEQQEQPPFDEFLRGFLTQTCA